MIGIISFKNSFGKKNGKTIYKFIPKGDDPFLITYTQKPSFSKLNEDYYAIVRKTSEQYGVVESCLGSVNNLESYYEFELHRKKLVESLKPFFNRVKNLPEETIGEEDKFVFTIDSETTTDFDDAVSIHYENGEPIISVYISNVPAIIEKFNLWDAFTDKVSTIYLPEKKRSMLPQPLETICSLKENCYRNVYVMEIGKSVCFYTKCVKINKNYVYEESSLLASKHYKRMLKVVQELSEKQPFSMETPRDSYNMITYLMIFMNHECAKILDKGIMRAVTQIAPRDQPHIFSVWMNWFGEYTQEKKIHGMLNVVYAHVTSPIRRLVDIINLSLLQNIGQEFCEKWLRRIDFINEKMKAIKKVQNNCKLMNIVKDQRVFDGVAMNGCIYISELNLITKWKGGDGKFRVKILLIANKESFKKIRVIAA